MRVLGEIRYEYEPDVGGDDEYEILDESIVVETKNGPYFGPEIDRKRINVQKD